MDTAPTEEGYEFLLLIKSQFTRNPQNIFHLNQWFNCVLGCTLKITCLQIYLYEVSALVFVLGKSLLSFEQAPCVHNLYKLKFRSFHEATCLVAQSST
jgi:hypothetical protein